MDTTETKRRTITLTGRPPVKIVEDDWPELASANYHDWDGEYDFQSFRHWRGSVRVRQHKDGRSIVYAAASFDTAHQGEREYVQRAGELLTAEQATTKGIVAAIRRVHESIDIVDDDHADQWRLLADECIADLPAEPLDDALAAAESQPGEWAIGTDAREAEIRLRATIGQMPTSIQLGEAHSEEWKDVPEQPAVQGLGALVEWARERAAVHAPGDTAALVWAVAKLRDAALHLASLYELPGIDSFIRTAQGPEVEVGSRFIRSEATEPDEHGR